MKYFDLPFTDLKVSQLCLGGMSFGQAGDGWHQWTLAPSDTQRIIGHALDQGINFIDTANCYANGTSESYIGQALRKLNVSRSDVVLASKVFFNEGGSSAAAISREIEGTLARLGTDYLDLYILHRFDYSTPIEETLNALNELVASGKVRALGASEMYAYQFHNMIHSAQLHGWAGFSTMQCHHNLLYRENEREMLPVCRQYQVLPTPYSPLASGHLARDSWDTDSVRSQTDQIMREKYDSERSNALPVVDRVKILADRHQVAMAQIALAWHWAHGPASPIVGFSKPERIDQAVAATNIKLSPEEVAYLEQPYVTRPLVGPLARPGEQQNAGNRQPS